MDLVTFLLARIGEDEAAAREASPGGRWKVQAEGIDGHGIISLDEHAEGLPDYPAHILDDEGGAIGPEVPTMDHIARWDPARVLAECASKRRIVALHEPAFEYPGAAPMCGQCGSGRQASGPGDPGDFEPEPWPCPTLDLLALPYSDHPDFQPEWRPEETAHQ